MKRLLADTTPLRYQDFRRLWLTNIVTMIGSQLSTVAVPQQLFQITHSSAYVGLAGLVGLVPLIVFGLWGGALADALDRRTLLLWSSFGLALTSLVLWLQAAAGMREVWLVLVLLAAQQALVAITSPTRAAMIARLLPGEHLPAANSLNMTLTQFAAIAGPTLAGMLIPVAGLPTLYLIDTIALGATVLSVRGLPPLPPTGQAAKVGLAAVVDGFRYLATRRVLLASFVVDIIAMVAGMPRALFPQMAHDTFGDPASGGRALGLLFAAMSVGAVVGGIFSGWVPRIRRQGLVVLLSIVVWGLSMVGFGLAVAAHWGLAVALLMLALGGAADMVSASLRSTMLQEVATDEMRGRLQGVFTVVVVGGPRLGDLAHGLAAAAVGTAAAAAGGGVVVVIGMVLAVFAFPAFARYAVIRPARHPHPEPQPEPQPQPQPE